MKKTSQIIRFTIPFAIIWALLYFGGCSYRNVDNIKSAAPAYWDKAGFEIVAYEGYQIGSVFDQPGGKVWYILQRKGDPATRYEACLSKWRSEYHVYNLKAIDAFRPSN